jgi:EmrB/QacA subfamily drug resistance transporter
MSGASAGTRQPETAIAARWRVLALLGIAQFMLILDVTVVAIALPEMAADLELSRRALTWVVSAYTLTFGGLLLLGGRSADLFGSRAVVLTGIGVFTAASLFTGLATGPVMLIGGRVAQGVGAALLSPAALSVIVKTFEGDERNRALGIWSALAGAGAAVGVLLGGLLTAALGWQWIFYVNVPIGLVVLVALARMLPSDWPSSHVARLDVPGAFLVTAGTAAAVYGVITAGEDGLIAVTPLVSLAVALALYVLFVLWQRASRTPLMDLAILTRRSVAAGTFLILIATALMISVFFLGSFYLQHYRHYDAMITGLLFLPVAAGTIIGAQLAGRTISSLGARTVAVGGLVLTALGNAIPAFRDGTTALLLGISLAGLGIGAVYVAASSTTLSQVDYQEAGLASGILSTFHEFGAAFGVAIISSLAVASLAGVTTTGFTRAFTFAAVAALISGLASLIAIPAKSPSAAPVDDHITNR